MKKAKIRLTFVPFYALVFLTVLLITLFSSNAITAMSQAAPLKDRHTIIIDAGHGGEDGGATSCTGVLESSINLEIALRLDDLLHFLGYDTVMIRTTDTAIHTQGNTIAARKASDLKERVKLVNKTEKGLLISIHQNYFSDDRYSGAQVFFPSTEGSEELGKKLQRDIVSTLNPGSKRQAKKASGVYLMEHIECTGVLIECGFISNREEEMNLRSENYQKKLCSVIASSVSRFLS